MYIILSSKQLQCSLQVKRHGFIFLFERYNHSFLVIRLYMILLSVTQQLKVLLYKIVVGISIGFFFLLLFAIWHLSVHLSQPSHGLLSTSDLLKPWKRATKFIKSWVKLNIFPWFYLSSFLLCKYYLYLSPTGLINVRKILYWPIV